MEPPVQRVHDQFIEKGGRFYVCPICFNERELDQADLVQNAELQGLMSSSAWRSFNYDPRGSAS